MTQHARDEAGAGVGRFDPTGAGAGPLDPLLVDLYELTMLAAFWREDLVARPATFSLFVRRLPSQRGYLVAAGLDDALGWLERLRFDRSHLDALASLARFPDGFLDWLATLRFTGTVRAVPEGTVVFADEPILEVDAPVGEAQLAESLLLNQISVQTTLATKAARCRDAARGRAVVDFALRRAQGVDAAMKLVRVSRIVGLDGTSNVAGAVRYGLPASGTMAHSFVEAYADETDAFRGFAGTFPQDAVLLVDTYDSRRGVEHAIVVARELREQGVELRGIRIDSGDLAAWARGARQCLDDAGFPGVRIIASGGIDEYAIEELLGAGAPIDGFGVGTALGVSADAPGLDAVYKLVAFDGHPVRKTSEHKATWPGRKQVWRAGDFAGDVLALADEDPPSPEHRALLEEVMHDGRRTRAGRRDLASSRDHFEAEWRRLPASLRALTHPAGYAVDVSTRLLEVTGALDRARQAGTT